MSDQPKPAKDSIAFGPKGLIGIDQPKPTPGECIITGASSRMCEHGTKSCEVRHTPKPTSEWTLEDVPSGGCKLLGGWLPRDFAKKIAAAHNAAIVAEREKVANLQSHMDTAQQNYIRRLNELNQELDDLRKAAQIRPLQ